MTTKPKLSEQRWRAVKCRDAMAEDRFVYAVKTTGIYCRPSCPSRRPRPGNVEFYDSAEKARAAGYRPCKRCRPDSLPLSHVHTEAVGRACALIEQTDHPPNLNEMAKAAGLSLHHFHRTFKKLTGVTPKAYAAAKRARRLREQLNAGETVTGAIYNAGYGAPSRCYEEATDRLGMTASNYRAGGKGTDIRFAVAETSLGPLLVAATQKGVCAVELGDDPDALVKALQDRFYTANLIGGDKEFETLVAKVCGYIEAPRDSLNLPLDVQGTAFQQRVWSALRKIPAGQTASYAEIARAIGAPTASRAVARACAANPAAIVIPCHRVVRTDGGLSGYRWGVDRKRTLLIRESSQ